MTIRVLREHENEPVPGLPHALPPDEQVLWRGRPQARWFARDVLKTRWIALYFVVLAILAVGGGQISGAAFSGTLFAAAVLLLMSAVVIGMLELIAWAVHRTTVYTITNKRLVLRVGIALPLTVNVPFSRIASVDRRHVAEGCGDLSFRVAGDERISWLMLWPHVRMWKMRSPQPVLRCIPKLDRASDIVASALQEYQRRGGPAARLDPAGSTAPTPASVTATLGQVTP